LTGEKVLVVDDRLENIKLLKDYVLEPNGYVCLTAQNGKVGLEKALREQPNLIIMDLVMPKMSGLEVLQALRDRNCDLPVILMTFHGSEETAVQAFRLGAKDYIIKPFEIEEMLQSIERALTEGRLRREREQLAAQIEEANRQLGRRVEELTVLNNIGQTVTSSLETDVVIRSVMMGINQILQVETGSLLLVDEESNELVFKITLQGDTERLAPFRLKLGQGIAGWVAKHGQPLLIPDARKDPRWYSGVDEAFGTALTRSMICVPLVVKDKTIGVIEVINKLDATSPDGYGQFTETDLELLQSMAASVGIALENARLYEAMQAVVAANILKQTVVTVSHYVNNPLTTLAMTARALAGGIEDGKIICHDEHLLCATRLMEMTVEEIAAVISILSELTTPKSITYVGDIKMIDIEEELKKRVHRIRKKYEPI